MQTQQDNDANNDNDMGWEEEISLLFGDWQHDAALFHPVPSLPHGTPLPLPQTTAYPCPKKTLAEIKENMQSQEAEDAELLTRFNGICGGSYIEMGALDGKTFSNSWLFHTEFDWKGVLIELDQTMYQKLLKNRPKELFTTRTAICRADTKVHYVSGHEAVNGIWEFASREFRQKWWPEIKGPQELETLDCVSLQHLLDTHLESAKDDDGFLYFDFFSLDVEGSEFTALQTIDWTRTHFGVLLVEAPDSKGMEKDAIVTFTHRQGYRYMGEKSRSLWFLHDRYDEIYHQFLT